MTSDVASPVSVSATPSSTEQLLPVAFAAHISASGPFVYVWDFGDGTTSADAAPAHSYIAPGTFTTVLHVIGPNDTIVGNATVSVVVAPILIAVGPNLPLEGSVGQTFHFSIDVYQGVPPYTFFWEFGDLNTSHVQNATHAYRLPGSYTATVWVNDSVGGQNIQTVSVVIPRSTPSGSGGSPSGGSIPYAWIGAGVAIVALVTGAGLWLTREPKP
ncbi:MAG TPA: PKD domain-containing protein [Thermoplasmata archaeon]|nr:PKD domain-containing protein [Thermoplasmata archaeon]